MAQSATPKTPLGTPVFWESGANPPSEWSTWCGTLKMAIMARDNLVVDKLIRLKPTRAELFYPTLPTYEDQFEGETEDEERQREQQNEKRKVYFWESGANPPSEWSTWCGTLKMAIMARDNLVVDKLIRLKPTRAELFYPTLPTYEDQFEGETEDEERQRERRNEKRKVYWENECKQIEYKGPLIDRTPWDEADLKVKSLIYLSLGTEGCRTYHQKNPHTRIEPCSTNELVHELPLTFTQPRNLTFDRFQFFRALQQSNESLETFYSRL